MTVLKLNRVVLSYEGQVRLGFTLYDQTIILACHDGRVPRHCSIAVVWYVATTARKGPKGPALAPQGVPAEDASEASILGRHEGRVARYWSIGTYHTPYMAPPLLNERNKWVNVSSKQDKTEHGW